MTTTLRGYPSRLEVRFQSKFCEICLEQIRAVDASRLSRSILGRLKQDEIASIKNALGEMFKL